MNHVHVSRYKGFPYDFIESFIWYCSKNRYRGRSSVEVHNCFICRQFMESVKYFTVKIQLEIPDDAWKNPFSNKLSLKEQNSSKYSSDFWKLIKKQNFGSTYVCEKTFSSLNHVKNEYRIYLTENHIWNMLLLSTSDMSPNKKFFQKTNNGRTHIDFNNDILLLRYRFEKFNVFSSFSIR